MLFADTLAVSKAAFIPELAMAVMDFMVLRQAIDRKTGDLRPFFTRVPKIPSGRSPGRGRRFTPAEEAAGGSLFEPGRVRVCRKKGLQKVPASAWHADWCNAIRPSEPCLKASARPSSTT
jgi:hypothetical protein